MSDGAGPGECRVTRPSAGTLECAKTVSKPTVIIGDYWFLALKPPFDNLFNL